MKIKKYFLDVKEILVKRRKRWIYTILLALFIVSFSLFYFFGRYAIQNQPELAKKFTEDIVTQGVFRNFKALLEEGKFVNIFGMIFFHNYSVVLIDFVLGMTLIFPPFSVIANGVFVGFIAGITYYISNMTLLQITGFLLVLAIEITTTVMVLIEGMYLSYSVLFPKKMWKITSRLESFNKTFRQNIRVLLFVMLLLLIAGIIETFVIYTQWTSGVKPIPF